MKQLRMILPLIVFSIMTISILSAVLTPESPDYDAWKRDQIKPVSISEKSRVTAPTISSFERSERGPVNLLVPLDDTFTLAVEPNDDGSTDEIMLPFIFSLYGEPYQSLWINNNGNVSFDDEYYDYTPWGFPIAGYPMLAPFFADVDTRGSGSVWHKIESNRMIVIWDHVGYYGSHADKLNTFEVIISDGTDPTIGLGNTVAFSYADMAWTTGDASGGDEGFGGTPATVGINKGDGVLYTQTGRFDHPGTDYDGPAGNNDGVDWLDGQVFYYNTGTSDTMSMIPTTYDVALPGVEPPAGVNPADPNTWVYYATYPLPANLDVNFPVGLGIWKGWIYYESTWHMADVFPVNGPGTIVFSDVLFGGRFDVPFLITLEPATLVEDYTSDGVPGQSVLHNAYPNPFKAIGGTTIEVEMKGNDSGRVAIYNLAGQELISYPVRPGNNSITWNGKDSRGKPCATGVYLYKLSTPSSSQTRKLVIIK